MIALPPGARVWLANGVTDMRKGMPGLALLVQEGLGRDPHAGDLHVFRGRSGSMVKVLWHDGVGMSLYIKKLERGRFIWPVPKDGAVAISAAQLTYLLDGEEGPGKAPVGRFPRRKTGAIRAIPGGRRWPDNPACKGDYALTCGRGVLISGMPADALSDLEALRAALAASEARADAMTAEIVTTRAQAARAQAAASGNEAVIATLRLEIEKLRRALYGHRSERSVRLLDQLELQLEEIEAAVTEDELAAEQAALRARTNPSQTSRHHPGRKPFPAHLPRERVVIEAPCACGACGSGRIVKLGEDITETLEVVPRRWKVIQTVRERFACRDCERISQPPAPFHPTPRGWAGPSFLAMLLFEKFGQHQPLNRQAERYAREGVELSLSTLADQVGAAAAALAPLHARIERHVMAAGRLHGDDTTVPVLAKGRTRTGRLWVYVRDDRPSGGRAPPAALFHYSPDRRGEHPEAHLKGWSGILQADAYAGFGGLYADGRSPAPVMPALCWAHARRKFYELADIAAGARRGKAAPPISPLALEAVRRIDAIFDAERAVNGAGAEARLAARRETVAPMVADLERWMREERARLSRHAPVAKAMDYMLRRWPSFASFLKDGRACLTNNAAERALRGVALGRKAWLFAGSDRGGQRAAAIYTLIATAKLNGVDPQAWLADVLARIADMPASRLDDLLPWNWTATLPTAQAA